MYTCLIIDKSELDRQIIISYLKGHPEFLVKCSVSSVQSAVKLIENMNIDIVFITIEPPYLNVIELRSIFDKIPVCIFISQHAQFAIDSFIIDTLDYLLKPLDFNRFTRTIQKIKNNMEVKKNMALLEKTIGTKHIFFKVGKDKIRVMINEILYLESAKNYTYIFLTTNEKIRVLKSLGSLLFLNEFNSFVRIHKGFSVNKIHVYEYSSTNVLLQNGKSLPVGKTYKNKLKEDEEMTTKHYKKILESLV